MIERMKKMQDNTLFLRFHFYHKFFTLDQTSTRPYGESVKMVESVTCHSQKLDNTKITKAVINLTPNSFASKQNSNRIIVFLRNKQNSP